MIKRTMAMGCFPRKSLAAEKATNSCSMRRMRVVLLLASFSVGDWRPGSFQHGHNRCRSVTESPNWLFSEAAVAMHLAAVLAIMAILSNVQWNGPSRFYRDPIKRFTYDSYLQHPSCDVLHSYSARWQVHCQTQTNPHDKGINSDFGVYLDADVIFLFCRGCWPLLQGKHIMI